jgi:isoleucyl-tRNA synthetase
VPLAEGEYELKLVAADADRSAPLPGADGVVVLDTAVTPELAAEGLARDVVRVVQQARREAGLDVADRIALTVDAGAEVSAAVAAHQAFIAAETLATSLTLGPASPAVSSTAPGAPGVAGRSVTFSGEAGDGAPVRVVVVQT